LLALDFEENPQSQMAIAQAEQFVTEVLTKRVVTLDFILTRSQASCSAPT
jgi:hypothetical protein